MVLVKPCQELFFDHSLLLIELDSLIMLRSKNPRLYNKSTDWNVFRSIVEETLNTNLTLKNSHDIESAVEHFNITIQSAAWRSTPNTSDTRTTQLDRTTSDMLHEKRKLRRIWQNTRQPNDKKRLNEATKELKDFLAQRKNEQIESYLLNLSPCEATDYSLWKATRKLNGPTPHVPPIKMNNGKWARSDCEKANTFANHLKATFQPYHTMSAETDIEVEHFLNSPYQLDKPIPKTTYNEVKWFLKTKINANKAPGYDLITGKVLQELPEAGVLFITQLFNAIIHCDHFPAQWKVAQITLIQKPGKPPELVTSYRPISLLPVLSKLFERILLKRINKIIHHRSLYPHHQFGFRNKHSTIEQINRVYQYARDSMEAKEYCTAAFIDMTQAFDSLASRSSL